MLKLQGKIEALEDILDLPNQLEGYLKGLQNKKMNVVKDSTVGGK